MLDGGAALGWVWMEGGGWAGWMESWIGAGGWAGLGGRGGAGWSWIQVKGAGCRRRAGWRGGDLDEAGLEGGVEPGWMEGWGGGRRLGWRDGLGARVLDGEEWRDGGG